MNLGDTPAWQELTFAIPAATTGWAPSKINQFGVQMLTTPTQGTAGQTVVAVDDFIVE